MTLRRVLVEHWDKPEADGGTVQAHLGHGDLLQGSRHDRGLDGTGGVRLVLPYGLDAVDEINLREIIRIEDPVQGTFEYRINQVDRTESEKAESAVVGVTALPIIMDLVDAGYVFDDSSGVRDHQIGELTLTPAQWIDSYILAPLTTMGETHWARGTVDFSYYVTITCDDLTPLALLRALESETGGEVRVRHNGATSILIDLIDTIGSTANTPTLAVGRNLSELKDSWRQQKLSTVAIALRGTPSGGSQRDSIDQFVARCTATVTGAIGIEDPETGGDLIRFDDQCNDWYLVHPADGTLVDITDSTESNQRLTVADATGIVVGDIFEFRANASNARVCEVKHPANVSSYGRRVMHLPRDSTDVGGRNYAHDPGFTAWSPSNEWEAVRCWLDGSAGSGIQGAPTNTVDLRGLPANFEIPSGTVGMICDSLSYIYGFITHGDDTADGSGDVQCAIVTGAVTHATDGEEVILFLNSVAGSDDWPDNLDWHQDGGSARNPNSDSDDDVIGVLCRPVVAAGSQTCKANGAWDGSSDHDIDLDGLPADHVAYVGDYVTNSDGTIWYGVVIKQAAANGSGELTARFAPSQTNTISDDDDLVLVRPTVLGTNAVRTDANRLILGIPHHETSRVPRLVTPFVPVVVESGWVLRAMLKYAYVNTDAGDWNPITDAELSIINDAWSEVASVTDTDREYTAESETTAITMTVDHTPSATDLFALSFRPPHGGTGEPGRLFEEGYWALIDYSLSYGPVAQTLSDVAYSKANAAFRACSQALLDYNTLPRVITVKLRDLSYDDKYVMADEQLTLGGNVRILSPKLDIDIEARVVRIDYDLLDPMNSNVTIDTEALRLTEAVS